MHPIRTPGRRLLALAALFAAGACCLAPQTAHARRSRKARVLVLRTEGGGIDDKARAALTKVLAEKARAYRRFRVSVSKVDLVEEMFEFECTEAGVDCLSKIGAKYKARMVIYSEVTKGDGGVLKWNMRVIQTATKASPIARVVQSTVQPLPDLSKPQKAAEKGLVVLIGPVDLPQEREIAPGTVRIRLVGGGVALVYVDDKLAGRTSLSGLRVKLAPGSHKVRVVRAGYRDWTQTLTVRAGAIHDRTVELEPLPAEKIKVNPGVRVVPLTQKWWFWTTVVGGAAAAGVVVWALTRQGEKKTFGNAAFSLDSDSAHLDPVFGP